MIGMRAGADLFRTLVRIKISADKFIDGGAPIFDAAITNSQRDRAGEATIMPLVIAILRVFVVSYMELAMEKRPEEARPWAIIIIITPEKAHWEGRKIAKIISAICATEA